MGVIHFKLNQISNIDALPCTGCLWTGVSGNYRSRSLFGMEASDSRSRIVDMDFFIPLPFPDFGIAFFHSLPIPEFWEWILSFPFRFRIKVLLVLDLIVLTTAPHSPYNDFRQLEWMRESEDEMRSWTSYPVTSSTLKVTFLGHPLCRSSCAISAGL